MTTTMKSLRLRLAQLVAPAGADVHDPDTTACPIERAVLEAVQAYELAPDSDDRVRLDVTAVVGYATTAGWVTETTDHIGISLYQLTTAGEDQLRRMRVAAGEAP